MEEKKKATIIKTTDFISLVIGAEEEKTTKSATAATLVTLLTDTDNKDIKEDVLKLIKGEPAALELLVEAIQNPKYKKYQSRLVAACWESGINCSNNIALFVDIAINGDYLTALEALTVVENLEGPFPEKDLADSRKKLSIALKNKSSDKDFLLEDLSFALENF